MVKYTDRERKITQNLIEVITYGSFLDNDNKRANYRVKIIMPDCGIHFLDGYIQARYLKPKLLSGKEWTGSEEVRNERYLNFRKVLEIYTEKDTVKITNKKPSFFNKSLFEFDYAEIQDFATIYNLFKISNSGSLEDLRTQAFEEHVRNILEIKDEEMKEFKFYKYDKLTGKNYVQLDEKTKRNYKIYPAEEDEELNDDVEKNQEGTKDITDVLNKFNKHEEEETEEDEAIRKKARDLHIEGADILAIATLKQRISKKKVDDLKG
jgi:hypothetical protein